MATEQRHTTAGITLRRATPPRTETDLPPFAAHTARHRRRTNTKAYPTTMETKAALIIIAACFAIGLLLAGIAILLNQNADATIVDVTSFTTMPFPP